MIGGSKTRIPTYVWLYIIAIAQHAVVAFLLLYFTFVVAEIVRPGAISLFFDVKNLLYLAGASIAVLMIAIQNSKLPYLSKLQVHKYSWVLPLVGSASLGWFTAWQVRGSSSYAILIGIVTGLLIFLLSLIMVQADDVESAKE